MLRPRYKVVLEKDGVEVVDEDLASILEGVERGGSILAAAREAGMPYSRAWEKIVRAERLLGGRIVETWRGGAGRGGARLTPLGEMILNEYRRASVVLKRIQPPRATGEAPRGVFVVYSSDPLMELVLARAREEGVEGACLGSSRSLAMLSLGEADVACIHLYDPHTGTYNKTHLDQYQVEDPILLGGYMRELVIAHRPGIQVEGIREAIRGVVEGRLTMATRQKGSATRLYLTLLAEEALGYKPPGWPDSHATYIGWTHDDTARAVAIGKADITLTLRHTATKYGLETIHVTWEQYQCYTTKDNIDNTTKLKNILTSNWLKNTLTTLNGYKQR